MQALGKNDDQLVSNELLLTYSLESFSRGLFDFIVDQDGKRHEKQEQALKILTDKETEEFCYGGAAGGAKSWTGCAWLAFMCLLYPGVKGFIGRNELKRITESTLITFFKVAKEYGFENRFKYNAQRNFILFDNASRIDLLDLQYKPSDPMFERFGSLEYTFGWMEEAPECKYMAFQVLNTRIGRHLNDKYGITGKMFVTANPNKNWVKAKFYDFWKKGLLEGKSAKKFLQCLVHENPFIESGYIERLKGIEDEATRARLLDGDWNYSNDPSAMCEYQKILAVFENSYVSGGEPALICDVAMLGSDKYVVGYFDGWRLEKIYEYDKTDGKQVLDIIVDLQIKHQVPSDRIVYDADGVGSYIGGFIRAAIPFVNNSRAIGEDSNYENLKTQCYYYLASKINQDEFYIMDESCREEVEEELGVMKRRGMDEDGKLKMIKKADVKKLIGRSPDKSDMMAMRSVLDLMPKVGTRQFAR